MPPLISEIGFPSLRKNPEDVHKRTGTWPSTRWTGFDHEGLVVPGIINMGRLLGVTKFRGLPKSGHDPYRSVTPSSAADIIVTVLYQRSHSLLRRFLECSDAEEFTYTHSRAAGAEGREEMPFVIIRSGDKVEAGFREGYMDGAVSPHWDEVVMYTIQLTGVWRQDFIKSWGLAKADLVGEVLKPKMKSLDMDADRDERYGFERVAAATLRPALTKRRWVEQPGFKIKVVITPLGPGAEVSKQGG